MRKEEYITPSGVRSSSRKDAILAPPVQVAGASMVFARRIPPRWFVATAEHESGMALNEIDTEADGYVSKGIWQLSDTEAAGLDPYHLIESTEAFARLQEKRLSHLLTLPGVKLSDPSIWAYLAISHNQGPAAAEKTVRLWGMNWAAYKRRNRESANPYLAQFCKDGGYGDAVISGGDRWWAVSEAVNGK